MKKTVLTILIVSIIAGLFVFEKKPTHKARVTIGDDTFTVAVVSTDQQRELGLGGRDFLPADEGMLFMFPRKSQYAFWMKGMKFPIDIIWISDIEIVDISHNVPVSIDGSLPVIQPKIPANRVLEINAGETVKRNIKIGDAINISKVKF